MKPNNKKILFIITILITVFLNVGCVELTADDNPADEDTYEEGSDSSGDDLSTGDDGSEAGDTVDDGSDVASDDKSTEDDTATQDDTATDEEEALINAQTKVADDSVIQLTADFITPQEDTISKTRSFTISVSLSDAAALNAYSANLVDEAQRAVPESTFVMESSYDEEFQLYAIKDDTEVNLPWTGFTGPSDSELVLNGTSSYYLLFGVDSSTLTHLSAGSWNFQVRFQNQTSKNYKMTVIEEDYDNADERAYYEAEYYYAMQDYDKALSLVEQGLDVNDESISLYYLEGKIYKEMEEYDNALTSLYEALALFEESENMELPLALMDEIEDVIFLAQ